MLNQFIKAVRKVLDVETVEDRHDHWRNYEFHEFQAGQHEKNKLVKNIFKIHCHKHWRVLEIGSGTGRNLNALKELGYNDLMGVELSRAAITIMKERFGHFNVHEEAVEDWIKKVPTNLFDCVFTMHTLQHIHLASCWVFADIARITNFKLITIEEERDYNFKNIFERRGLAQLSTFEYDNNHDMPTTIRIFYKK